MKVSFNWLRELADLPAGIDAAAVARALTNQGLEVESITARGHEVRGVLVAEVVAVKPHPGADKLRIVRLRAGGLEEDVVCGAPNVPPPGNRVCWAPPGSSLPGGLTLTRKEIRGVSSPGMICSEVELGIAEESDGILILDPGASAGAGVAAHLGFRDDVLEVNVTPNRPDALSHVGLARELAAHFGTAVRWPEISEPAAGGPSASGAIDVKISDEGACPRYQARFVADIAVGPSPIAARLRLGACGMRSISNVVDATNYVLLETGYPLHAFDLDKLSGSINVRRAVAEETIVTLDGQTRVLAADDIVIADDEGAVALAGVMGGASSEVSAGTRRVLLEAATFDGRAIRRTARRLGLHSEASYRYERGVDAGGIPFAAARVAELVALWSGGKVSANVVDRYPRPAVPRQVVLSARRLARVTGKDYGVAFAREKLERLGMKCEPAKAKDGGEAITVMVPTYRPDIAIEEDIIEEVLRMGEYGQGGDGERERIISNAQSRPSPERPLDRARDLLAGAGLHEIVTWAFVPRASLQAIAGEPRDPLFADGVLVKNPISADYEVMRTSLLPGLADALRRNLARGAVGAWLFEVGPVVRRAGSAQSDVIETNHAAGILSGQLPGWLKPGEPLDFFDAKQVVEELLRGFGVVEASYKAPARAPFLHPGVSAEIESPVGRVGEVHPQVARRLGLDVRAFYFEVEIDALAARQMAIKSLPPPRFPSVGRDVSFWIDANVPAAAQSAALWAAADPWLREVAVREDFRDPRHAPAGKKGMLWSLVYRADDRTLTDVEVDAAHARVVAALSARQNIQIR